MEKFKNVICFFNTNKAWGGGEKWHLEAGQYLEALGHKVYYITQRDSKLTYKLKKSGLNYKEINCSRMSFLNPFKIRRMKRQFEKLNIETVITNLPQDFKLAGLAATQTSIKRMIYRRGMPHPIKDSRINKLLFTRIYTHIIANSIEVQRGLLKHTSKWFPQEKIQIVYNGVKTDELIVSKESYYSRIDDEIILGNAGRLVEQKGQKYLLELAKILRKNHLNFKILIAGTGPLEDRLKAEVVMEKLENEIIFLGHVTAMPKFFNSIDLFVFPSLFEGLANTLVEAMAYRIPCIGFNLSSIPEVIENGKNGYLIQPFNIEEMATQIIEIWKNKKLLEEFKNNAYVTVLDKFDYKKNMEKLIQIVS